MIKAVLLDLDDTLITSNTHNFFPAYLRELGQYAAAISPPEQFVDQMMSSFERTLYQYDPARPLYERVMERFSEDIGHELATLEPLFASFYRDAYQALSGWIRPRPESRRLLEWLFDHDYTVVVATNPGLPEAAIHHRMRWGDIPPEQYDFDMITTLESMHFGKPTAEYYSEIVLRLGVEPHEAIMVGDDWDADLVGAAAAGLHTFWVTTEGSEPPDGSIQVSGYGTYESFVEKVLDGWLDTLPTDGNISRSSLIHRLAAYPAAIDAARRPYLRDVLECNPAEDEWSARDIVCHLRDHEAQTRARLERILAEDNPFLSADTNPWAAGALYRRVPFEEAFDVFVERREAMVEWLKTIPEEGWKQQARDAIFGPTCFEEVVSFLADHDRMHLQQMKDAIEHGVRACDGA